MPFFPSVKTESIDKGNNILELYTLENYIMAC